MGCRFHILCRQAQDIAFIVGLMFLVVGYEVSAMWLPCCFLPYVTRHTGVSALAGHRVWEHSG